MTKRNLILLATLVALILSPVQPLLAQDGRPTDNNRTPINRQSGQRTIVTERSAEQLRSEMISICDEAEATFKFMAGYSIAQDGIQKVGYENISGVLEQITDSRKQIEAFSDSYLQTMNNSFPDSGTLERLTLTLRKMRSDPGFQSSLEKAEKWFNSENRTASSPQAAKSSIPSTPSSPAFLREVCDFGNLTNFPSPTDIGITQGVLLVVDVILLFLDIDLGNNVPNPAYFVAVAAKAITGAILLGLEGARDAGLWCQDMAFNIQGALTTDGQFVVSFMLPRSAGGYEDFIKDFVTAILQKAMEKSVPTNCGATRLAEANNYYDTGNWANAYKKYRSAYANIAADTCVE